MTLMCLANLALGTEIVVSSTLTGVQSIRSPQPAMSAGKLSLQLPPKIAVTIPGSFDVATDAFSMCVSVERDGPELFVSATQIGLRKTPVSKMGCDIQNNVKLDLQTNPNQSGKIVTLLLAPE